MASRKTIVFRADGSATIGVGHLMRCCTLARALSEQGYDIVFACQLLDKTCKQVIGNYPFNLSIIEKDDLEDTLQILKAHQANLIIIDHYQLNRTFESEFVTQGYKVMAIDDFINRSHNCHLLLDTTFDRKVTDYGWPISEDTLLALGSDYALIRSEFSGNSNIEKRTFLTEDIHLLISFGGTDPQKFSLKALEKIIHIPEIKNISILLTSNCPWIEELYCMNFAKPVELCIDFNAFEVAELLNQCHIAIGSTGSSTWERCVAGLPTVAIPTIDNQMEIAEKLARRKIHKVSTLENLSDDCLALIKDTHEQQSYSNQSKQVCDGQGAKRVVELINQLYVTPNVNP